MVVNAAIRHGVEHLMSGLQGLPSAVEAIICEQESDDRRLRKLGPTTTVKAGVERVERLLQPFLRRFARVEEMASSRRGLVNQGRPAARRGLLECGRPPAEGNLIKAQWLRSYDFLPEKQPLDKIVQSWDCAAKSGEINDYSVCLTFLVRKNEFYLMDVLQQRLSYPELKKKVLEQKTRFKADVVLIGDMGHGTALIQDLRGSGLHAIGRRPEKDKITRMSAQSAKIEAGQLLLPTRASWLEDFKSEILAFPASRHDDQVDALSQFLPWADERCGLQSWPMPIVISRPREMPFESLYRPFPFDSGY
jgi:predicted phage terminase large subunit-like protein